MSCQAISPLCGNVIYFPPSCTGFGLRKSKHGALGSNQIKDYNAPRLKMNPRDQEDNVQLERVVMGSSRALGPGFGFHSLTLSEE